jgi:hypothetical protein
VAPTEQAQAPTASFPKRPASRFSEPLYRCPECMDKGWALVVSADSGLPPIAEPCRHCRTIERRRWAEGHYNVDHYCDECGAIRSGRVTRHDFDLEGNWLGASEGF